ncbi:hypothetical protein BDV96DRAFT_647787 [Lophiotrema nucula]|uniref:Uncharacterized protein n=1 Tax=Lophiotrema nucula TaxID=690887 RepID=A0A6A5Z391_9PLEO|nr:hypothetical protein BDV96DRAFT_647787 [Lophiotrema nucula]
MAPRNFCPDTGLPCHPTYWQKLAPYPVVPAKTKIEIEVPQAARGPRLRIKKAKETSQAWNGLVKTTIDTCPVPWATMGRRSIESTTLRTIASAPVSSEGSSDKSFSNVLQTLASAEEGAATLPTGAGVLPRSQEPLMSTARRMSTMATSFQYPHVSSTTLPSHSTAPEMPIFWASANASSPAMSFPDWGPELGPVFYVILFTFMFLGLVWVIFVCLINLPPPSWFEDAEYSKGKKGRQSSKLVEPESKVRAWLPKYFTYTGEGKCKKKVRPIDKPSKYAPLLGDEGLDTASTTDFSPAWMRNSHSRHNSNSSETGLELRSRRPQHRSRSPYPYPSSTSVTEDVGIEQQSHIHRASTQHLHPNLAHIHSRSTSPASNEGPHLHPTLTNRSRTPSPSPTNPLLPNSPAHRRRTSEEWVREREDFFRGRQYEMDDGGLFLAPPNLSHSSPLSSSSYSSLSDADALEAQTSLLPGNVSSKGSLLGSLSGGKKAAKSILNGVEGAVNGVVNKMVEWTEDHGGKDELLLPMRKGDNVD